MVLTPRERNIGIGVGGLLAVVILWYVILGPYISAVRTVSESIDTARAKQRNNNAILKQRNDLLVEWKQIQGAMAANVGDARQEVRDELNQWAASCGLNQKALNDVGTITHADKDFDVISFTFTGQGSQKSVASFVYLCEKPTRLLRISKIVLKPVKEGQDDLTVEMTVTTICKRTDTKPRLASNGSFRGNSL